MPSLLFPLTVSNLGRHAVTSRWRVRSVKPSALHGDPVFRHLNAKPLEVGAFGLIEHRCDQFVSRRQVDPAERLKLKLQAGERAGIALVVDMRTKQRAGAPLRLALFALEEKRSDGLSGGVLVAVTSNGGAFTVPPENLAPRPLPLILVDGPRLQAETVYGKGPVQTVFDRTAGGGFLGFLMRNTGPAKLRSVVFYPECISLPGVQWQPSVFEMDELDPGEEFFAAFPFDPSAAGECEGRIRLVGYSASHDRTRFDVAVRIVDPNNR